MSNDQLTSATGRKAAMRAAMALIVFCLLAALVFLVSPGQRYVWVKALHVIAVISWMAGMVYLPRLFVYHADAVGGGEADTTFKVMERRLLKVIMTPAMVISWLAGLWLAYVAAFHVDVWFWIKFAAVVGMTVMHFYLAKSVKRFAAGQNTVTAGRWRALNEIPTVLMIVSVVMVIVKPFG